MDNIRKIQASPWFKGLVSLLLVVCAALGGLFGTFVLRGLLYQGVDSWQDTGRFTTLLQERQASVAALVADSLAVGRLPLGGYTNEEQWAMGVETWESAGGTYLIWPEEELGYVEIRRYEQDIETHAALLDPEQTWFRFQVRTADGTLTLGGNLGPNETMEGAVDTVYYATFQMGEYWVEDSGFAWTTDGWWEETASAESPDAGIPSDQPIPLVLECGVARAMDDTVQDDFWALFVDYGEGRANFDVHVTGCANFLSLAGLCVLALLWTGGHKKGAEGIVLTWQERIFFDLYLLAMAAAGVGCLAVALQSGDYLIRLWEGNVADSSLDQVAVNLYTALFAAAVTGMVLAVALTLRTLAVRVKARALARSTLLCRVLMGVGKVLGEFLRNLSFTWKAGAAFLLYFFVNLFLFTNAYYWGTSFFWLILNGAVFLFLCWWAVGMSRLRKGSRAIAAGDLDHRVDTRLMPHDLRMQAEDLNNISVGLAGAVDEKMRSERFKAELITNVSHDLKTPLTSIINYVDLLKTTQQTDPKAAEYIQVLDRKSQRLKKLTEDLVEASKASTGTLAVHREKIGMGQLMDQALGEWTEKLEDRKLTVVANLPEGETWVYADGRHLWRVIDNLLSNCAKYAMEGTRVYLDLTRGKGQVTLSVKNVSRDPLNIPPERLMERFVRGEESRTTEGSGLGLSIARSLTELQGGEFHLSVDGDLFKATVTLPQAN